MAWLKLLRSSVAPDATVKALDGENPSMVRRWAGHRKYEMTDYYFGLAEAKLAAIKPKQSTLAGLNEGDIT